MMGMRSDVAESTSEGPLRSGFSLQRLSASEANLDGRGKAAAEIFDLDQPDGSDLAARSRARISRTIG